MITQAIRHYFVRQNTAVSVLCRVSLDNLVHSSCILQNVVVLQRIHNQAFEYRMYNLTAASQQLEDKVS